MNHYCTIFDKNYLLQGMALYRSLCQHSKAFKFYVLCMDRTAYDMLYKLEQEAIVPVFVDDFVDAEIHEVRQRTSRGQFCWVCQPLFCQYLLKKFQLDMVTYLEADSLFFSSPQHIFDELAEGSVSLVPHRYTDIYDQTSTSGKYCVQFNAFRNNEIGHQVLNYWKECCFEYSRERPEYYPGQIFLDLWPSKFEGVVEIQQIGAGTAPWNVQQYTISKDANNQVFVDQTPLVFYHYHQFSFMADGKFDLGTYSLSKEVIDLIYKPYVDALYAASEWLISVDPTFTYKKEAPPSKNLFKVLLQPNFQNTRDYYWKWKRRAMGIYNVIEV